MKTILSVIALPAAVAAFALSLTGCETTGNPREGGIFWSENKAQDRLNERQQKLDNIQGKTNRTQADSAWTQQKINSMQ